MITPDLLMIGRLGEIEQELITLIEARTGYIVEFTDKTVLARYAEAPLEGRLEIVDMLLQQARLDAKERGFEDA